MNFAYRLFVIICLVTVLVGCGIQSIPQQRNAVDAAKAEIVNQYQRRSDLIPNLVSVVKGYAAHEQQTLEAVTLARTKATSVELNINDAQSMQKYQQVQGEVTQTLSRLLVVSEKYPDLKANENFRELQVQLEGTENRIAVARTRFIDSIQKFNNLVTVFPTSLTNKVLFHHLPIAQFGTDKNLPELEKAPNVRF